MDRIEIIGQSEEIEAVRNQVTQVAKASSNVLILGESGTGKELVARSIHEQSTRKDGPFVPVNCGAIPSELLESELFGHEKGAFTGAVSLRKGRFEIASGGTIFLDEIGDMPLNMQVKLLRVLQEKVFERVGSNKSVETDVRVIAATHTNLEEAIAKNEFREDLFYRLNVLPIEIAPLRQRRVDILPLIEHFIDLNVQNKKIETKIELSTDALDALLSYSWPGNIRELSNIIERLVTMYPGRNIELSDLPLKIRQQEVNVGAQVSSKMKDMDTTIITKPTTLNEGFDLKQHLNDIELNYILTALEQTAGVVSKAARILGLRRTTLVEKIKKFQIDKNVSSF